ncbi:MAG: hypothetical protein U0232_07910 [Thermomicrobiales bacterium]
MLLASSTRRRGVRYLDGDLRAVKGARYRQFRYREIQAIFQDPFEGLQPVLQDPDHLLTVPIRKFGWPGSRAEMQALMESAHHAVGVAAGGDAAGRPPPG